MQGVEEGSGPISGSLESAARALFAAYQGSVLASRLFKTEARLEDVETTVKVVR